MNLEAIIIYLKGIYLKIECTLHNVFQRDTIVYKHYSTDIKDY